MTQPEIVVSQIWIYPLKSLGGIRMARSEVTAGGSLALDREWVVATPDGIKLWQGDLPRMALSRCTLEPDAIVVTMPGMPPLRVPREHDGPPRSVSMYKHDFAGVDAGDDIAAWLSEAFGRAIRLVRIADKAHRWPGLNPVHVISRPSLDALNAALAGRGDPPVEPERFRPNLLLDVSGGGLPAYFEEGYDGIRFGDGELRYREPCVRCELPNISRADASRGRQPLKLIGALSRERSTAAPAAFGTYSRLVGMTEIAEGMRGAPLAARTTAA